MWKSANARLRRSRSISRRLRAGSRRRSSWRTSRRRPSGWQPVAAARAANCRSSRRWAVFNTANTTRRLMGSFGNRKRRGRARRAGRAARGTAAGSASRSAGARGRAAGGVADRGRKPRRRRRPGGIERALPAGEAIRAAPCLAVQPVLPHLFDLLALVEKAAELPAQHRVDVVFEGNAALLELIDHQFQLVVAEQVEVARDILVQARQLAQRILIGVGGQLVHEGAPCVSGALGSRYPFVTAPGGKLQHVGTSIPACSKRCARWAGAERLENARDLP